MSVSAIKFVDREDECRFICHPHLPDLRDQGKPCCVVIAKQPGAGKTFLAERCLETARNNHPEGEDPEIWQAKLPVLALYCVGDEKATLAGTLTSIASYATQKLEKVQVDPKELKIGSCERIGTKLEGKYGSRGAEDTVKTGIIWQIFDRLMRQAGSLNLSKKTTSRLGQLRSALLPQPLLNWASVVLEIVEDESEACKVYAWVKKEEAWVEKEEATLKLKAACTDLRRACEAWTEHFRESDVRGQSVNRPAALLIVIDEAQWVLPGQDIDELYSTLRETRREIRQLGTGRESEVEKLKTLHETEARSENNIEQARLDVKTIFEDMRDVFKASRFLWAGVNSSAVDLQMSYMHSTTAFRVVSVALPPLDVAQWSEALGSRYQKGSLMEMMLRRQQKLMGKPNAVIDEAVESEGLEKMMRHTGGWPVEVRRYAEEPDEEQRAWVAKVFGSDKRKQRMGDLTLSLLDRVFLEPGKSVFAQLEAIEFVKYTEAKRTLYELLHLSGLRLVDEEGAPAMFVSNTTAEGRERVAGIRVASDLRGIQLRHTTGSLWLQARLTAEEGAGIFRGPRENWEKYTSDEAEGATINMLRFLKEFSTRQLKDVFPWFREAPPAFANTKLESDSLCVVRGLMIREKGGLEEAKVPHDLEKHEHSHIGAETFNSWLSAWSTKWLRAWNNGDKRTYIYVFGRTSASGDILLILGGIHFHIQVKNAKKAKWDEELEKMKPLSCPEVPNVYVLINYYDYERSMRRPYEEMSKQRTARIQGLVREVNGQETELPLGTGLVVELKGLWEERLERDIKVIGAKWLDLPVETGEDGDDTGEDGEETQGLQDGERELHTSSNQPATKIRRV